MKSYLYHLQLNINFANKNFYGDLMKLLGWEIIFETKDTIGYQSGKNGDLWFVNSDSKSVQNYDHIGLNHIAIRVNSQSDIDKCVDHFKQIKIEFMFETPKHREEFVDSKDDTYYQIMFKSADNILFEIVYIGPKT